MRFLNWLGIATKVFNVGNYRRKTETGVQDAAYFDGGNTKCRARREELAMLVLDEMLDWLVQQRADADPGDLTSVESSLTRCAIFDATNTTRERRKKVAERIQNLNLLNKSEDSDSSDRIGVIFLESVCDEPEVLEQNLRIKLQKSPDYANLSTADAMADLEQRISFYEKVYEPLEEESMDLPVVLGGKTTDTTTKTSEKISISYIKILNLSSHVTAHNIFGRAAVTILPYLMALHVGTRPVVLCGVASSHSDPQPPPRQRQMPANRTDFSSSEAEVDHRDYVVFCSTDLAHLSRDALCAVLPEDMWRSVLLLLPNHVGGRPVFNPGVRFRAGLNALKRASAVAAEADTAVAQIMIEIEQEMRPVLVLAVPEVVAAVGKYFEGDGSDECAVASGGGLRDGEGEVAEAQIVELNPNGAHFQKSLWATHRGTKILSECF
eukprot:g16451.t1